MKPLLVVLAGPNGAGKSTFQTAHLAQLDLPFLNADIMARVTGLNAYEAAEQVARLRDRLIARRQGFILETVLSDPVGDKVAMLASAVEEGFDVVLIFVGIASANLSVARMNSRSQAGGHSVPVAKLKTRYPRTLENLTRAIEQLPRVVLYDNSSYQDPFRFVAEFRRSRLHRRGPPPCPAWARQFLD